MEERLQGCAPDAVKKAENPSNIKEFRLLPAVLYDYV